MASRGASAGGRPGTSGMTRPRPTRSQLLRQAKNVAVVVPEAKQEARKPARPREGLAKMAPPPAAPRKVVFDKPKMTKAMLARQAKAQEKIQEEERKRAAIEASRRRGPRRAAPPPRRTRSPARQEQVAAAAAEILEESRHSARAGNAEVIQAIPVGDGEVGAIVIPPGVINEDQTTIIQIAQPDDIEAESPPASMNRSIQIISDSLNEQEAAEAAAVQEKLDDFQHARRDFIMELASVTAPGLDPDLSILDVDRLPLGDFDIEPSPPRRKLQRIPSLDDPMFQLEHGRDHPAIIAAREYRLRKEAQKRFEDKFDRAAAEGLDSSFDLDAPLYQDIQDADISFEEDEMGEIMPCRSRVKAPMPRVQRGAALRSDAMYYPHSTFRQPDIDELERFFNIEKYPASPRRGRAPPGREQLHRDLWELEDPWYREATPPDVPDLMEFSR